MPIYFDLSSHKLPLTVDSIGNRWYQESVQRPNGFPHYHWLQTESGAGEVIIGGKRFLLPERSGILIAPFIPHSYRAINEDWSTSFVTFSGKLEADINKIVGHEQFIPVEDNADFSFQDWIDGTISYHEAGPIDPIQLSINCYTFLMNINKLRDYREFQAQPLYQNYIAPVIKEIETNYPKNITVQSLANTVYITPQYLNRLFKRFLGCGTYQYLTNYRLSKAKELLVNRTHLPISQVSFLVGYHDTSHFIAMFKRAIGCTPFEFRQLHH
ncbi:MAG: AraC family transcriptional regulator [Clostridiales bacterium]|nr:AraC family transcriptional regulator [Clostridiales bacterium]